MALKKGAALKITWKLCNYDLECTMFVTFGVRIVTLATFKILVRAVPFKSRGPEKIWTHFTN